MDCDEAYALLDAYVDRELDVAHDLAIATHLQACQRCLQQYEALLALQAAFRTRGTYYGAPPSLHRRLQTALRRAAPAGIWKRSGTALAALALLVLLLGGGLAWRHWSPSSLTDGLVREIVAAHVRSLQVDHLIDVASTDPHTLKPWFSDKLAFAPPVIDLTPHGFQLLGARLDYLNERAVAAVVYRRRQHRINLWILPTASASVTAAALVTHHGYQVLHWTHAGMAYWAVSDLNQQELGLLKPLLQQS